MKYNYLAISMGAKHVIQSWASLITTEIMFDVHRLSVFRMPHRKVKKGIGHLVSAH